MIEISRRKWQAKGIRGGVVVVEVEKIERLRWKKEGWKEEEGGRSSYLPLSRNQRRK